jgi:outer membrane protein assembly factor BamB
MKDNHYALGSYCFDPTFCPAETPRYDFVSLDPNLSVEWRFRNTNTFSCRRELDGEVTCVSNQPDGFEWCINQPGVDGNGVAYANSEDGFLYAIAPGGTLAGRIFLDLALGAAYTPLAISGNGLIYAQNNGHLFVVGNPLRAPAPPVGKNRVSRSIKPR